MGHRLMIVVGLLLGACAPAPTPFPVAPVFSPTAPDASTPNPEIRATAPATIRYGVLDNTAEYLQTDVILDSDVEFVTVGPSDDLTPFDIVVGYGLYEGWMQSEVEDVTVRVNTGLPPLDNPVVADAVTSALSPSVIVGEIGIPGMTVLTARDVTLNEMRSALANAGYPDGITLYAQIDNLPGVTEIIAQLGAATIDIEVLPANSDGAHIEIGRVAGDTTTAVTIVPLYSLPISYIAQNDIAVRFTEDGWPIPDG